MPSNKILQSLILLLVLVLQYAAEHLWPQQKKQNQLSREKYNTGIGIINLAITALPAAGLVYWINFLDQRNWGLLYMFQALTIFKYFLAFLLLDLYMYWWHRMNHQIPLLWKFHAFHHADDHLNTTPALRFHLVELLFSFPAKALALLVIGVNYPAYLAYETAFFIIVLFHHSNIAISPGADKLLRLILSTPHMHRVHHSINIHLSQTNYGSVLSWWDRLFKSFKNPTHYTQPAYGLPHVEE